MIIYNPYGLVFDDVVMVGKGLDLSGHATVVDHGLILIWNNFMVKVSCKFLLGNSALGLIFLWLDPTGPTGASSPKVCFSLKLYAVAETFETLSRMISSSISSSSLAVIVRCAPWKYFSISLEKKDWKSRCRQ